MDIDFEAYAPYRPPVIGVLQDMPRRDASICYGDFMASRSERVEELRGLLARNGLALTDSDESIQELNRWYVDNVALNPTDSERLENIWYAVTFDIGVFLAEVALARNPGLQWVFNTFDQQAVSYQCPVIRGFTRGDRVTSSVDVKRVVVIVGDRAARGLPVFETQFVDMLKSIAEGA